MLLLKPEVGNLRLAAAEIVCELLVLDFSSRCRVFPPYHSHAWYTPWSVFKTGRLETSWGLTEPPYWKHFPSAPGDGFSGQIVQDPPLLPPPESALSFVCRKSASRPLPDPQLAVLFSFLAGGRESRRDTYFGSK
jgi:hypothetical protein